LDHRLIKEARRRAGLAQSDLARRLGTTQSAIARWESGKVSPRMATLKRLLKACGVEANVTLVDAGRDDRVQIAERLAWTPKQRLAYLTDMVAFEERAGAAHRL
jgi:transcriptional regulator with XRE-family HTH domain